ncbi:DUF5602 domain-containing protein [Rufibacter latericius]|uniref:Uncharacterized protein n=1 Tax=Rufibacter latericius TaxID=2487040 RepID=A0A3M9MWA3_9BACT|nr:DUF5602 domain-containing protein [Rufibacter latericius]RNI29173.1 hypothetical protein EFB08_07040 [Rufibacter latericius]
MKKLFYLLLFFLSSMVLLPSCDLFDDDDPEPNDGLQIYRGATVDIGNGKATAWISVNNEDEPVELGLELTNGALQDLPHTNFSVASVPLPDQAKELTPFDHIQIDWASQGHGMPGPTGPSFIDPHYDIRFFMTSLQERMTIPAPTDPSAKFDVLPPTGYMPADYFPGGSRLPGIGRHWADGLGFLGMTNAMVLGSYNGKFTFVSPIVTITELQSRNKTSTTFSQPQYFQESNTYYPTKYNIYADETGEQNHQVTLSDFVLR